MIASVLKIFFSACLFFVEGIAVYRLLDIKNFIFNRKIILSCVFCIITSLFSYQQIYSSFSQFVMYIILSLIFSYVFQISIIKSVLATGIAYLILAFGDIIGSLFIGLFFELNTVRNNIIILIIGNVFVIIFILFVSFLPIYKKLFTKLIQKVNCKSEKNFILFIILAIVFICVINLQISLNKLSLSDLFIVLLPIVILFILFILYIFERNKYQILNSKYEVLFTHATSLESWLENERVSYHEYKNQLAYIRSIIKEEEAIQYIDSILQESFENSSIVDTQIVNIPTGGMKGVIFYKLIQAQKKNIQTCISISPKMKKIEVRKNVEKSKIVCRILGILMDNAIDAAFVSDEKKISLEMYCLDKKFVFVVMNTFKGKIDMSLMQEKGYTTKGYGHGNGLGFVKSIISRHSGLSIQTNIINGYYTQKIIIEQ